MSSLTLHSGFVKPEKNQLPDGWVAKPLSSFSMIRQGGKLGLTKESHYISSGVPAFSAAGCDGFVEEAEYKNTEAVVLSAIGANCGRCFFAHGNWTTLANVQAIIPNEEIDPKYFFYRINQENFWERSGSAQPFIKPSSIGSSWIAFPQSKIRQKKIAAILTGIDTAIEKTEALIEKYQQIKAGLMHDLFTRGVLPNGQLRPPRAQAPELYQETAIGWIPKEWGVSGLAPKARKGTSFLRTGPFGSSLKGEHWVQHGHPVITIGALGEGDFLEEGLLFVGSKDTARLRDFQLVAGDVVFSRVADVGRSVVVRQGQAGWIMSSNLMRIAVDESVALPDFVQMQLAFDARVKRQIRAKVTGGGREVANSEVLSQLRFVWPEIEEQGRIVVFADRVNDRLKSERNKKAKLEAVKLGLMQDLLTGKVPVKVGAGETAND